MSSISKPSLQASTYQDFAALIFDMDGTLVDSVDRHDRVWHEILTAYKIPFTAERMLALGGVPSLQTVEILCFEAGIDLDCREVAIAKEQRFIDIGFDGLKLTPLIDVVQHYAGIKAMAVGTGAHSSEAHSILKHFGIYDLFDAVVCADMVESAKPAPDTFLLCAEKLSVPVENCVVFEDADGGLLAAKQANMACVDVRELWTPERLFTS